MRYLNELNLEELKEVYEKNSKLQTMVFDDMMETASLWCDEYLDCFERGSVDYCIGWDRGTYFKCKNRDGFIDGLKKAQKNYGFLSDDYNSKIEYVEKLIGRLEHLVYWDEVNEDRLNVRIDELIEELETACYQRFMNEYEYCFNSENQLDYFINDFVERCLEDQEYYVDEDMIMYRDIYYKECLL